MATWSQASIFWALDTLDDPHAWVRHHRPFDLLPDAPHRRHERLRSVVRVEVQVDDHELRSVGMGGSPRSTQLPAFIEISVGCFGTSTIPCPAIRLALVPGTASRDKVQGSSGMRLRFARPTRFPIATTRHAERRAGGKPGPSVANDCESHGRYSDSCRRSRRLAVATRPVPGAGFEPARPCGPTIRSRWRLPVPPAGPGSVLALPYAHCVARTTSWRHGGDGGRQKRHRGTTNRIVFRQHNAYSSPHDRP